MSRRVDLLVFVHGMTVTFEPISHRAIYEAFWKELEKDDSIRKAFPTERRVYVEYTQELPGEPPSSDEHRLLSKAQRFILEQVSYDRLRNCDDPENHLSGLAQQALETVTTLFGAVPRLKEKMMIAGMGDAAFYSTQHGEDSIRIAVYGPILDALEHFEDRDEVRLHMVTHSLGATVAYDFLFGLFAPREKFAKGGPGFLESSNVPEPLQKRYSKWRERAHSAAKKALAGSPVFKLGSLTQMAGQLPTLLQRSSKALSQLHDGRLLEPNDMGLDGSACVPGRGVNSSS